MVLAVSQSKMEVEFGISLIIPAITVLPTLVGLTVKVMRTSDNDDNDVTMRQRDDANDAKDNADGEGRGDRTTRLPGGFVPADRPALPPATAMTRMRTTASEER